MSDFKVEFSKDFFKAYWGFLKRYSVILLILVLVGINVWIRLTPFFMEITDEWAESSVLQNMGLRIKGDVLAEFPNLPGSKVDELVSERLNEFRSSAEFGPAVVEVSAYYKERMRSDEGIPYLHEIDPYFWYRHAMNILDHGYPGDIKREGRDYTLFRLAPNGNFLGPDEFHSYLMVVWGLFMGLFGLSIFGAAYFLPVFLTSLAVIPAFLIGRKIGGKFVGFLAGLFIIVNTQFLARTPAGFADTDAYTVLMPLWIIWAIMNCLYSSSWKGEVFWACLAGFFVGLFGWAWIGWSFAYDLVLGALFFYGVYLLVRKNWHTFKYHILRSGVFVLSASVFLFLFRDWRSVVLGPFSFLWFVNLQDVASTKIWPNVLTTVAEQNVTSLSTVINILGGNVIIVLGLLGFFYLVKEKRYFFLILSIFWICATSFAATRGTRYVQLMLPIIAVLAALGIYVLYFYVSEYGERWFYIVKKYSRPTLVVIILLLFFSFPVGSARYQIKHAIPEFSDAWYNSLHKIATDTPEDVIISSWWDWGHWFKAIGERGVTFDGTSQDSPQAHWIGKVLLTGDEREAVNIMAMLNCDGNGAFEDLTNPDGIIIRTDGISLLKRKFSGENFVSSMPHLDAIHKVYDEYIFGDERRCDSPRPSVFITSQDMVYKAPVWAHFGAWNFTRAQIVNDVKRQGFSDFADEETVWLVKSMNEQDLNSWISPWPQYMSGSNPCDITNGSFYYCTNSGMSFSFDMVNESFSGPVVPKNLVYVSNGSVRFVEFENSTENFGITLSPDGFNVFSDALLTNSVFNRLFYLDGVGLKSFTKFYEEVTFRGQKIQVWMVELG